MRSVIALAMSLSLPAFAAIAQDLAAIPTGVVQVDVAAVRRQTLIDQIACHHVVLAAKRPSGAAAMVATLASVGTPSSVVEQRRVESGVDDCMTARGYQAVAPTPEEEARLKTALVKDSHVDPWAVKVRFAPDRTRETKVVTAAAPQGDGVVQTYSVGRF